MPGAFDCSAHVKGGSFVHYEARSLGELTFRSERHSNKRKGNRKKSDAEPACGQLLMLNVFRGSGGGYFMERLSLVSLPRHPRFKTIPR